MADKPNPLTIDAGWSEVAGVCRVLPEKQGPRPRRDESEPHREEP